MFNPTGQTLSTRPHPRPLLPSPQAQNPAMCPGGLPFKDRVFETSRGGLSDLQGPCPSVYAWSELHCCPPSHNLNVLEPVALQ